MFAGFLSILRASRCHFRRDIGCLIVPGHSVARFVSLGERVSGAAHIGRLRHGRYAALLNRAKQPSAHTCRRLISFAFNINAVNLKNDLAMSETDCRQSFEALAPWVLAGASTPPDPREAAPVTFGIEPNAQPPSAPLAPSGSFLTLGSAMKKGGEPDTPFSTSLGPIIFLKGPYGFPAIHDRHFEVHQNYVRVLGHGDPPL
jgi:hypothetical protein